MYRLPDDFLHSQQFPVMLNMLQRCLRHGILTRELSKLGPSLPGPMSVGLFVDFHLHSKRMGVPRYQPHHFVDRAGLMVLPFPYAYPFS